MRPILLTSMLLASESAGQGVASTLYGTDGGHAGFALAATTDGGWVLAGKSGSIADGSELMIIKVDAQGTVHWSHSHGSPFDDEVRAVQPLADGGFIACGHIINADSMPTMVVLRLDSVGALLWERTYMYPGGASKGFDVVQAEEGAVLAVGFVQRRDTMDAIVLKFLPDGTMDWEKRFDMGGDERAVKVLAVPDDGYAVLISDLWSSLVTESAHLLRISADGETIWRASYANEGANEAHTLPAHIGRRILITGTKGFTHRDAVPIRSGPEGQELWRKTHGSLFLDEKACTAVELPNGEFLVGGSNQVIGMAGMHAVLIRFNGNGEVMNQRRFPQGDYSEIQALSLINDTCLAAFGSAVTMAGPHAWSAMRFLTVCESAFLVDENVASTSAPIGIHPNPADQVVRIRSWGKDMNRIVLWEAIGRNVFDSSFGGTQYVELSIDRLPASVYTAGVYFIDGTIRKARLAVCR
ncbi:MAG: hypothetical protein IPJ85_14240 [Flavobacteriales bacterium]|nr:hypothetical protein [Flavobacteriales bacterium]